MENNEKIKSKKVEGKYKIAVAVITVIGSIIVALIYNNGNLKQENLSYQTSVSKMQVENSSLKDNVADLESKIASLQEDNSKLQQDYQKVNGQNSFYQQKIFELEEKINNLSDESNTNSTSSQAESPSSNSEENNSEGYDFLSVCKLHEGTYDTPATVEMAGDTYTNCLSIGYSSNGTGAPVLCNLKGKYNKLRFDVGHIDGRYMRESQIIFYCDDKIVKTLNLYPEDFPKTFEVPLNGAEKLKIESSYYSGCYALTNIIIY